MPQDSDNSAGWWIERDGKPDGPFTHAYIVACLKSGTLPASTQVLPDGGSEWKPVSARREFAEALPKQESTWRPPPPPARYEGQPGPLTNPKLPAMANVICVYGLVVRPAMFLAGNFACCVTYVPPHPDSPTAEIEVLSTIASLPFEVAVTAAIFVSSLMLRRLRKTAVSWLTYSLVTSLVVGGLWFLADLALGIIAAPYAPEQDIEPALALLLLLLLIVLFAEMVFQIVAVVWLLQNKSKLPLED